MIKKLLLLSVVLSQLAISCSSDDSTDPVKEDPTTEEPVKPTPEQTLAEQVAAILKQPYSALAPADQKVKLEAEANEMLVQLDKTKGTSAMEAIENLERLLDVNQVDVFNEKNGNEIEDILNVADVYGIYTWNNTNQIWVKTASTTDLKFVFPAKESQTSNNTTLSVNSVSSSVKVKFLDTYATWGYNPETDSYGYLTPDVYDQVFLPTSANATLTIDGAQAATITQTASYSNGKEAPDTFSYKMTLNDGYVWEMSGKKGASSASTGSLTFNGKSLITFNAGSSANIDGLLAEEPLNSYRGKANALITLMDNFVIVADMDLATDAADDVTIENTIVHPSADLTKADANHVAYFTARNLYNQKYSAAVAASFNKNIKLTLVSKKDGTKIADVIQRSEKLENKDYYTFNLPVWRIDDFYDEGGYWGYDDSPNAKTFTNEYYDEEYYLKFNDQTQIAMSAYFSEGFGTFESKFEEFIKAFEKK